MGNIVSYWGFYSELQWNQRAVAGSHGCHQESTWGAICFLSPINAAAVPLSRHGVNETHVGLPCLGERAGYRQRQRLPPTLFPFWAWAFSSSIQFCPPSHPPPVPKYLIANWCWNLQLATPVVSSSVRAGPSSDWHGPCASGPSVLGAADVSYDMFVTTVISGTSVQLAPSLIGLGHASCNIPSCSFKGLVTRFPWF